VTLLIFSSQGQKTASIGDLAHLLETETDTLWLDITGPDEDDIHLMRDVFHFHPLAIEDTRNQRQRPKVEEYADYLFFILNAVSLDGNMAAFRELDVFIGKNYIVTVHTDAEPVIQETHRRIERLGSAVPMSPSYLLYVVIDTVVDSYFPVLDLIEEELERMGDDILRNPRQETLNDLFELKQILIDLWRVIWPQREILNNLVHQKPSFIDVESLQHHLRDVTDHLMWIADMITTFRDALTSIAEVYMSAVSNRLNKVVNRLTVFTVVIGISGVLTGFYGMNFEHTWPPFSSPWGVPFVLVLMGVIAGTLLYVLRKLNWY